MKDFPLFISPRLKSKLALMNHRIAKDLLSISNELDEKFNQTFIDIDDDFNYVSFIQSNKAIQLLNADENSFDSYSFRDHCYYAKENDEIYTKYRSRVKWGRFLNTNFPDKYKNSISGGQNEEDIESFINKFKALCDREAKFGLMDIVSGAKIGYWYNARRYFNNDYGTLSNSCMKNVSVAYFNIYIKNPDKCKMLIMYSDDTKRFIKARALVWMLDEPVNRVFMDRVYTNDYSDEQIFIDYAKANNWIYKVSQSMGYDIKLIDPSENELESVNIDMFVNINKIRFYKYPYCDTFSLLNKSKAKLGNNYKHTPNMILTYTGGDYGTLDVVYSNFHGSSINREDAIWCELGQDWVRQGTEIRVFNTERQFATPDYKGIVEMTFEYNGKIVKKHFLKNKCVWSKYLNTWIFNESVVSVNLDLKKEKTGLDHSRRVGYGFFEVDGENWATNLF